MTRLTINNQNREHFEQRKLHGNNFQRSCGNRASPLGIAQTTNAICKPTLKHGCGLELCAVQWT